ncbi:carbohydrate-binding protein [Nocardia fluminea]|uniref:carbohydrate-binding protein n=1 Tax=Nocardia fluminea TaxID=134984 RepID=UPI003D12368D
MPRSSRLRRAGLATPNSSPPESARSSADPRRPISEESGKVRQVPCDGCRYPISKTACCRYGYKVAYQGVTYSCRQAHTVHDPNWTPPNTPALWSRV